MEIDPRRKRIGMITSVPSLLWDNSTPNPPNDVLSKSLVDY